MNSLKNVIVAIPGLGGHESSLREYATLLPDYDFRFLRLVDHRAALAELIALCRREENVILLSNCYGIQLALRLAEALPEKVRAIIVIEAFFAEFHAWRRLALAIDHLFLATVRLAGRLGLTRTRLNTAIDYAKLAKYPIYMQPLFDMWWQPLVPYFLKIEDILTFRLPQKVATPTLFIVSPKGYLRSADDRHQLQTIFVQSTFSEVPLSSHNIVALAASEIAPTIRRWLTAALRL